MPNVLRLRFMGDGPVLCVPLGRQVMPEELCEVPGRVLTDWTPPGEKEPVSVPADADFLLVETGNPPTIHAWPKSTWRDETPAKKPKE